MSGRCADCVACHTARHGGKISTRTCNFNPPVLYHEADGQIFAGWPYVGENDWCMKFVERKVLK